MTIKESIFRQWAPIEGPWTNWVKPVVFASIDEEPPPFVPMAAAEPADWIPRSHEQTALVFDLPGITGVEWALAAAKQGFQPVPLYNALPLPAVAPEERKLYYQPPQPVPVVVDMLPILSGLWQGAAQLEPNASAGTIPPAFMLDANRGTGSTIAVLDLFDNRSVCFSTDFPSADWLLSRQVRKVVWVQSSGQQPQRDLRPVLTQWQKGGVAIERKSLDEPGPPVPCSIKPLSWFERVRMWLFVESVLVRRPTGEFGCLLSEGGAG